MKHASFFSGVGGLDLGFERAGISTVSVSEIDPYASSVLAERFPSAPNFGNITEVNANDIPEADIWSGGFPCQDLSVAGKRAGFAGKRSSLAFTFLDLVEQRRPRWLVLENVPGLFSSNGGADFGRLLYEMEQLRYGVSWRTLDARYFGVAQRRRRVFLVASLECDRAGEVLLECEGCGWHPAPRWSKREGVASIASDGSGIASELTRRFSKGVNSTIDEPLTISPTPDTDGVRAADGLAGRLDDREGLGQSTSTPALGETYADALTARDWKGGVANQDINRRGWLAISAGAPRDTLPLTVVADTTISFPSAYSRQPTHFNNVADPLTISAGAPAVFRKSARAQTDQDSETWVEGDVRTTHAILGGTGQHDPLLPVGLDSHRYRCCGNGVVAPVAEWIGRRIVEVDRRWREEVK